MYKAAIVLLIILGIGHGAEILPLGVRLPGLAVAGVLMVLGSASRYQEHQKPGR